MQKRIAPASNRRGAGRVGDESASDLWSRADLGARGGGGATRRARSVCGLPVRPSCFAHFAPPRGRRPLGASPHRRASASSVSTSSARLFFSFPRSLRVSMANAGLGFACVAICIFFFGSNFVVTKKVRRARPARSVRAGRSRLSVLLGAARGFGGGSRGRQLLRTQLMDRSARWMRAVQDGRWSLLPVGPLLRHHDVRHHRVPHSRRAQVRAARHARRCPLVLRCVCSKGRLLPLARLRLTITSTVTRGSGVCLACAQETCSWYRS